MNGTEQNKESTKKEDRLRLRHGKKLIFITG